MNKKAFFITMGFVAFVLVAIAAIVMLIIANTKELKCTSSQGNITLRYSKKDIIGYAAKNMTYDLDEQKEYAKKIGIDAYLEEFKEWFANNTDGTCK